VPVDHGVAALLGAGISSVVALGTQFVGSWLTARLGLRPRQGERLSRFPDLAHGYVLAVGQVAREGSSDKDAMERTLCESTWTW
jgi:hypothetical protein